jgi:hypothetical protein
VPATRLQRACSCKARDEAEGRRDDMLWRGTGSRSAVAPPIVGAVLRSPGRPLDPTTRAVIEPRLRHDFGRVRVHTDGQAEASARAVEARAYTVGPHIVFGRGEYAPATGPGMRLLAHELVHVMQQRDAMTVANDLVIGPPHDSYESEADRVADAVAGGTAPAGTIGPRLASVSRLQRQPCSKADDRVPTGPLVARIPDITCAPTPEALATVRGADPHDQNALGLTQSQWSGIGVGFPELKGSRCQAKVTALGTLDILSSTYTKAGTYADGTEDTPRNQIVLPGSTKPQPRPCQGKRVAKQLKVLPEAADLFRRGEIEHCEDKKLAFSLSLAKYNQAISELAAADFCMAEPPDPGAKAQSPVPKVPAGGCPEEGRTRFKRRTGVELDDINRITGCLMDKSGLRDSNQWHTAVPQDLFYSPDCTTVTYIYGAGAVPDVAGRRHPSAAIVKGCGEM